MTMIYFDYAATGIPSKKALDSFLEISLEIPGNPNSLHQMGRKALSVLEKDRKRILECLSLGKTHDLVFTSGASESNNLALKGVAALYRNRGTSIVSSAVEHSSIVRPLGQLGKEGFKVSYASPDKEGVIRAREILPLMDAQTILVSVMAVNNELGTINEIQEIAKLLKDYPKCLFHVDATQLIGKLDSSILKDADLISFSAHKFGGPKGVGGLFYRKGLRLEPLVSGGAQEKGLRGGTVNVPAIHMMRVALEERIENLGKDYENALSIWDFLYGSLKDDPEIIVNSACGHSPYVFNFSFRKKKASVMLEALSERGICVSSVSACSSKGEPISQTIYEMTKDEGRARNSMRLSFGPASTILEAEEFLKTLEALLKEVIDR